jgi:hypothetical protein
MLSSHFSTQDTIFFRFLTASQIFQVFLKAFIDYTFSLFSFKKSFAQHNGKERDFSSSNLLKILRKKALKIS